MMTSTVFGRLPAALVLGLLLAVPAPAHALRVVSWNLLKYDSTPGSNTITQRQALYRTVMAGINADLVILQELNTAAARDSFVNNVLNLNEPGQWSGSVVEVQSGSFPEFYAVCWKPTRVAVSNVGVISPPSGRKVLQCLVKPVGYLTNPGWFRLYSVHLKAGGPSGPDSTTRRLEATEIRNTLNAVNQVVVGPNFLIGGDFNFYGSYEGAYHRLTESQADNDGLCVDPLPSMGGNQNWHEISGWSPNYTQSTCAQCPLYAPFTNPGGGLDDRFDIIFSNSALQNGEGLDVHAYFAYGNDGFHYNNNINAPPNTAVGQTIADALWGASDHLPVVMDLRLPARVSAVSQLVFPTVIQGAVPHDQNLTVNNNAAVPGDDLDYSLSVAGPFSAPPGSFSAAAGAGNLHTLSLSTANAGNFAATLAVATDDPDSLTKNVLLSGRVLRHAVASLDSQSVVTEDTLKFGSLDPGQALVRSRRVHDQGYDALQARLSVFDGQITGPDASRFAIVGGFTPVLIGGIGHTWSVAFDTTGAAPNSTYEATLVFSTADEPLPGSAAASDLTLHLVAGTQSTVSLPEQVAAPLSFYPPRPNPLRGRGTDFDFGLPKAARVSIAIYDATGRRVTSLMDGEQRAGITTVHWNGRDDSGAAVPAGLYFMRFSTPGLDRTTRLVVLP